MVDSLMDIGRDPHRGACAADSIRLKSRLYYIREVEATGAEEALVYRDVWSATSHLETGYWLRMPPIIF